jgi:hypothetical protein
MKRRSIPLLAIAGAACLLLGGAVLAPDKASTSSPLGNKVLRHGLDVALGNAKADPREAPLSASMVYTLLEQTGELDRRARSSLHRPGPLRISANGCQSELAGNGQVNIKVNQDCSLRQQAGESIAIDPVEQNRMLVAQNDSRVGFGHCGIDWSTDAARQWGDFTPPFFQFLLLDDHAADSCVDPTVTWDSQGNAYVAAILVQASNSNAATALVVAKSDAGIGGAYFHSTDPEGGYQEYRALPLGVVASVNDPNYAYDKAIITADTNSASPKRDHLYVTWTLFGPEIDLKRRPDGVRAVSPIYFRESSDGGATWSRGLEINGTNAGICGALECSHNQGSHPVIGADGTIYVSYANRDAQDGIEQILFVKCPPSTSCSDREDWSQPVRVAHIFGSHPTGPSDLGCPLGSQCLPPNGYVVNQSTSISLTVDPSGNLFVVWADFRNNTNAACRGNAQTARPPCDNDVFYARSTDGGLTWSEPRSITPRSNPRFGETAQWQPWSAMASNGHLWVAFYDRSYGGCELTGCNDITTAEITNPTGATPTIDYSRVTTESMPNLTTSNNPLEAGFLGDRLGLDIDSLNRADIAWADTRPAAGADPEEDVYFARVPALPPTPPRR